MKLFYLSLAVGLILTSCSSKSEDEKRDIFDQPIIDKSLPLAELAKRHVEADLKIPATEKYALKIYEEDLDGDDKKDAIITVNRLEFAYKTAETSGNAAKMAELDFFGNYNFIFYFDGALNKISPAIPFISCPQKELKVKFIHLLSDAHKDVVIDYRIKNSSYKDFITVRNHTPNVIFEWNEFENLGTPNAKANFFEIVEKNVGLPRDIVLYEGVLENNDLNIKDVYNFTPKIKKKNKLYTWFYNPEMGKYATRDAKK
jgi:hypothetical protein